ncbi:hypothetical protein OG900_10575 [Streptomyces sp. NBC_00433]
MSGLWADRGPYHAWADYLENWAAGAVDLTTPPALAPEDLPQDGWQRLLTRIDQAVSSRLQAWADALVAALSEAPDEFSAGRALAQSRAGLRQVLLLTRVPSLPEDFRSQMAQAVGKQVQRVQFDLERELDRAVTAGLDARWVEARRRTLRDNPLTAVLSAEPAAAETPAPAWSYDPAGGGRRRVVPR